MKIGIILTAANMEEYVEPCLAPWIRVRELRMGNHDFIISAINVEFKGFPKQQNDGTRALLERAYQRFDIDNLIIEPNDISETEARGLSLKWLKEQAIDIVWQVDIDEFYTIDQIANIIKFIELNEFVTWFRLSLKNYVFDNYKYIVEPFTPARIYRTEYNGSELTHFTADNNIAYGHLADTHFASMTIPISIAFIKHMTWQNNLRSKRKIQYQLEGRGWPQCSFSWDDSKGGLIFNPEVPAPKISSD